MGPGNNVDNKDKRDEPDKREREDNSIFDRIIGKDNPENKKDDKPDYKPESQPTFMNAFRGR